MSMCHCYSVEGRSKLCGLIVDVKYSRLVENHLLILTGATLKNKSCCTEAGDDLCSQMDEHFTNL